MADREENVYRAKLAEQAERYDDMKQFMYEVVLATQGPMSEEERNLLSVSYKYSTAKHRSGLRNLYSVSRQSGASAECQENIEKIEVELRGVCAEILELLETNLIPNASPGESITFFYKMQGDYYRYMAECTKGDDQIKAIQGSRQAYEDAIKSAQELPHSHPLRLGLALNFSVFYYEIENSPKKAIEEAQGAINKAYEYDDTEELDKEKYRDASLIIGLLKDNIHLWTNDMMVVEDVDKDAEDLSQSEITS